MNRFLLLFPLNNDPKPVNDALERINKAGGRVLEYSFLGLIVELPKLKPGMNYHPSVTESLLPVIDPEYKGPRHEHDCECCSFLGRYNEFDLYFCSTKGPTIIARYGALEQYYSGLIFGLANRSTKFADAMREALIRAVKVPEYRTQIVDEFKQKSTCYLQILEQFIQRIDASESLTKEIV